MVFRVYVIGTSRIMHGQKSKETDFAITLLEMQLVVPDQVG